MQASGTDRAGGPPEVLSTLTREGKRKWICPKLSKGRYLTARRAVAIVLIAIFTLVPYLRMNGRPLVLLDVASRRFTLFGTTFLPNDTVLLALLLVLVFVGIFLATSLFGRVWCGWACPQTVYMEFVFRPIERLLNGKPGATRKNWIARSGFANPLKYLIYLLISMYLAHTFLAYFVGVEKLAEWVRRSPTEHPTSFLVMLGVTAAMMFDFSYFREQTCIVACPYGRFQSVMLDRDSLIVTYDRTRGEPRGKKRPAKPQPTDLSLKVLSNDVSSTGEEKIGDCVDCHLCVTTCPTGIDIRNGLQMECINCAQCIDACDAVMTKLGRATGLIRYSSQNAVEGSARHVIRPRVVIYAAIMTLLASLFVYALSTKSTASVIIVRGRGAPFTETAGGMITNRASIKLTNRTESPIEFSLSVVGIPGATITHEESLAVDPESSKVVPVTIGVPFSAFTRGRIESVIRVSGKDGAYTKDVRFLLMGPGSLGLSSGDTTAAPRDHTQSGSADSDKEKHDAGD
ncbi:MAG: cytochrome c oxidase accessory protein CcoG [Phycisphaeraceae bacterium]|nr:MAG: cytochrome c oxidase accessory protein CcoG [Phycisphaeraceae bacterium]